MEAALEGEFVVVAGIPIVGVLFESENGDEDGVDIGHVGEGGFDGFGHTALSVGVGVEGLARDVELLPGGLEVFVGRVGLFLALGDGVSD